MPKIIAKKLLCDGAFKNELNTKNKMIKTDYVLPEKRNDKWMQGFVCAVCVMIKLDGMVETRTREMYKAGVGQLTIGALEKRGVDKNDLETLEEFWYDLH